MIASFMDADSRTYWKTGYIPPVWGFSPNTIANSGLTEAMALVDSVADAGDIERIPGRFGRFVKAGKGAYGIRYSRDENRMVAFRFHNGVAYDVCVTYGKIPRRTRGCEYAPRWKPAYVPHPGKILMRWFIEPAWSFQSHFAEACGLSKQMINYIVKGICRARMKHGGYHRHHRGGWKLQNPRRRVDLRPTSIPRIAKLTETSLLLWTNLQSLYAHSLCKAPYHHV